MDEEKKSTEEENLSFLPPEKGSQRFFKGNDGIELFGDDANHDTSFVIKNQTKEGKQELKTGALKKKGHLWKDLFLNIFVLIFVLVVIRGFVALPFEVNGSSMEATLHDKELIYVDLFSPYLRGIQRGDVVVFHPPIDQPTQVKGPMCFANQVWTKIKGGDMATACNVPISYVKRIIGVPGDNVEIKGGSVYITDKNGKKQELSEPYLSSENQGKTCLANCASEADLNGKKYTVLEGQYFLLGDNRQNSSDSRTWNLEKRENITGVVRAVFFYHGSASFGDILSESGKRLRIIHSIDPLPSSSATQ